MALYGIYYQTSLNIPASRLQEIENDYIILNMNICATSIEASNKLKAIEEEWMEHITSTVISSSIKFDIKQVKSVEKVLKMTPAQKELFQREIEMMKHYSGKPNNANFSYQDLLEIGKDIVEWFNK